MPESELPEEIWEVNPSRIIGLTNDVEVLSEIRKERMIAYGLDPETVYSDKTRIKEIDYAMNYTINLIVELSTLLTNLLKKQQVLL